jgi:hypothetical protein
MFHGSSSIYAKRLYARCLQPWPPEWVVASILYGGTPSHGANTEVRHTGAGSLAAALVLIGGKAGILIAIRLIHDTTTTKIGLLLDVGRIQFTGVLITDMFSLFIFHYDQLLYVRPSKQGVSFFFAVFTRRSF